MIRFPEYSPFQTDRRGQYYARLGWTPQYLIARDDSGEIAGIMIGLLREYPFGLGVL